MITDLRLQNFRSYKDASFELSPGVNIVVGPNASGKTNLLEAVLVLSRGGSYRARDPELVQFNKAWARLDADLSSGGKRTLKLTNEPEPGKLFEIDGKTYKRITVNQKLPVVLFEPNHLLLLSSSPERRRDYLDDLLEQTRSGYGAMRRQYRRTLIQRNNLLKQGLTIKLDQFFPWNVRLSQLAGRIIRERLELVNEINKHLSVLYKQLSNSRVKVEAVYQNRWPLASYESQLMKKLESSHQDDAMRGFTSFGPHREDLIINLNDKPVQSLASRGEIRTIILALKIIELKIIEQAREQTPLLLLDDVFSELDGKRRHALTDYLAPYQTFITTTDADAVVEHFTEGTLVLPLA